MAQALTHKRNARTDLKPAIKNYKISDWDSLLYSIWLEKMALNPIFDDATIIHGHCKCCSRTILDPIHIHNHKKKEKKK
jgi:hypothetical protein